MSDLLERLSPTGDGRPRLVGVDGFSGAGKTTLAAALADRPGVSVVSIEQFYRGWDGLEAGVRQARRELVDALLEGRAPVVTPWDWRRAREGPPTRLELGGIVVLEGCGAGAALLRAHQDLTVWVDADVAERDRRLRARGDWAEYAPHRRDFERQEQRLAARERTRAHADVVVSVRPEGGFDLVGEPTRAARAVPSGPVSTPTAPAGPTGPTGPAGAPRNDDEAWRELAAWKGRVLAEDTSLLGHLGGGLSGARASLVAGLRSVPGVAHLDDAVHLALHQLAAAGAGAGANTVRREAIFARFRAHGFAVKDFRDIRRLDVADVQTVLPRLDLGYVAFAGVQGGLTSFLTSSGAAAAAGGAGAVGLGSVPGVATVAASLAGDAVLTVAACTRAVAHVAAYYGYDVGKRSERVLALAVLAVGLSSEADAPEAYEEVASLVRTRAQDKERKKRQQRQLQRLAKAVHQRLLSQIGQRELAQLVPVVGIGIGAVLSARLLAHVVDAAEHLYRERFLHDRYDIPFGTSDEADEGEEGKEGEEPEETEDSDEVGADEALGTVTALPRTQLL